MIVLRIFILFFFPMALWIGYSWSEDARYIGEWELRKIDKVELLKLVFEEEKQPLEKSVETPIPLPQPLVIAEENLSLASEKKVDTNKTKQEKMTKRETPQKREEEPQNLPTKKERIFVLGDSMGEGVVMGFSRLKKEFYFSYTSIAKCSTTTNYWLAYEGLEEKIKEFDPTLILVVLGTNEWNNANSATMVRMMKLKKRLLALGVKTIWVTPPIASSEKFSDMVHQVFGETVYDSRSANLPRGEDHIHPTPKGYETWSRAILSTLHVERKTL